MVTNADADNPATDDDHVCRFLHGFGISLSLSPEHLHQEYQFLILGPIGPGKIGSESAHDGKNNESHLPGFPSGR